MDSHSGPIENGHKLVCTSWKKFPNTIQANQTQDENIILNQTVALINVTGARGNTNNKRFSNETFRLTPVKLQTKFKNSFELNQSYPTIKQNIRSKLYDARFDDSGNSELKITSGMDKIRVDGFNGLRFSARRNGCFTPPVSSGSPYSGSLVNSASESLRVSQAGINPNKAVFTIESKTSQILIVNRNACELLGYTPNELCSMQLSHLLSNKKKNHVSALAEGQLNSEDGTMVLLSGKVVEMTTITQL